MATDHDRIANKRLANKVIWALEDINAHTLSALALWEKALQRAELRCADPALLIALVRIKSDLSEIRILATAARNGEYAGRQSLPEHENH